jgi:hypothetical protein
LQQTIRHGRQGQMPAQEVLQGNDKVHLLAAYVYSLSITLMAQRQKARPVTADCRPASGRQLSCSFATDSLLTLD